MTREQEITLVKMCVKTEMFSFLKFYSRDGDGQFTRDETEMCGYLIRNRDWCLAQWLILSISVVRTWDRIPLGQFLVSELNFQYPVKSFAPYLGGCRGRVPSDSLRKFLQ